MFDICGNRFAPVVNKRVPQADEKSRTLIGLSPFVELGDTGEQEQELILRKHSFETLSALRPPSSHEVERPWRQRRNVPVATDAVTVVGILEGSLINASRKLAAEIKDPRT
jgi:hypothetical protein